MDHLLDRALGEEERLGDRGVVLALGHLPQDVTLPGRQLVEAAIRRARAFAATSPSTTFGSITEPPSATVRIGGAELLDILDPLLEQVRAAAPCRPRAAPARTSARAYWLRTTTPTSRVRGREDARAAWIPSSSRPGGIRMSVIDDVGALGLDRCEQRLEISARRRRPRDRVASRAGAELLRGRGSGLPRAPAESARARRIRRFRPDWTRTARLREHSHKRGKKGARGHEMDSHAQCRPGVAGSPAAAARARAVRRAGASARGRRLRDRPDREDVAQSVVDCTTST